MRRNRIAALLLAAALAPLGAQEAIHSNDDILYDFLALVGKADRPYLNYKTLSDSDWDGPETWRVYGPELFTSFNSSAPYGTNDGPLWQGRGLNSSLTAGLRFSRYGFEFIYKPQFTFSQNQNFRIMDSAYESDYGYIWAYSPGAGADAPQRFGDELLFDYSWGDSELRYNWKKATIGLGTQSPWLGPGHINAIMHSNNAPPYPKLDLGLRRNRITAFGRYLGDIEARLWAGYLSESDYFDSDDSNDHNLISGLAVAYAPAITPGLTFFLNRTYLSPWEAESAKSLLSLFFVDLSGGGAQDVWDQRASIGFDYLLSSVGLEIYGELGINDYAPSLEAYIRYPFHSMVYLTGIRKSIAFPNQSDIKGELIFEWLSLEVSQDYQLQYPASFYMHYQILQGYTNEGQWIGAGIGTGGNSQYLGLRIYYPRGFSEAFIQRVNPDNDYIYTMAHGTANENTETRSKDFRADLSFGITTAYNFSHRLTISGGLVLVQMHNQLYYSPSYGETERTYNFRITTGLQYRF